MGPGKDLVEIKKPCSFDLQGFSSAQDWIRTSTPRGAAT